MTTISLTIVSKNECHNIAACIESAPFVNQVVVIDSGSTDGTVEIALAHGADVEQSADWRGFGVQKNRALARATGDWVLSLDADERLTPALVSEICAHICAADKSASAVVLAIPRLTNFCGTWIRHCGWTPDYVVRVFKRGTATFSDDLVHERLIFDERTTRVVRLKNPILHHSYPNPSVFWSKLQKYSLEWATQKHAEGQTATVLRASLSAVAAFVKSYVFRLGFLDGAMGFAVCVIQAQFAFGKYFQLYCLGRNDKG